MTLKTIFIIKKLFVHVSLAQLVWTMHKICKVRDSNPGHHKKINDNFCDNFLSYTHIILYFISIVLTFVQISTFSL